MSRPHYSGMAAGQAITGALSSSRNLNAAERAKHATGSLTTGDGSTDWGYFNEKGFWNGGFSDYDEAYAHALMTYKD